MTYVHPISVPELWFDLILFFFFLKHCFKGQDVLQELAVKPAIIKNPVLHFATFLMNHWINIWPDRDFCKLELTFLTLFSCPLML